MFVKANVFSPFALAAGLSGLGLSQRQREAVAARTAIERKRLADLQEIERIRAGRTKDQADAFIKDSKGLTKKYLEEFDKKVNKPLSLPLATLADCTNI